MGKAALRLTLSLLATLFVAVHHRTYQLFAQLPAPPAHAFGVYVNLVDLKAGAIDDAVAALRRAAGAGDWQLLADYEAGVDQQDCSHRAHVFVVHSPAYARSVLQHGAVAAFAVPLRLTVYEDERGIHVATTNPRSLNRTIIAETGFEAQSDSAMGALEHMVASAFPGQVLGREYGQMRERGLIGKTMRLMAGGPFPDKVETVAAVDLTHGETLTAVAQRMYRGLERLARTRKWQIRPAYLLDLAKQNVVIIGVTGAAMEARAMHIVGAGNDDMRKTLACPGLDHAAAFPVELVLSQTGGRVTVTMIDAMFRMKLYFEDAGNLKFAANMTMPGSIGDEIKDEVEEALN